MIQASSDIHDSIIIISSHGHIPSNLDTVLITVQSYPGRATQMHPARYKGHQYVSGMAFPVMVCKHHGLFGALLEKRIID